MIADRGEASAALSAELEKRLREMVEASDLPVDFAATGRTWDLLRHAAQIGAEVEREAIATDIQHEPCLDGNAAYRLADEIRARSAEAEVVRLREALGDAPDRPDLDLHLLSKLAYGDGGRRTGALRRAGYLVWRVTDEGLAALEPTKP